MKLMRLAICVAAFAVIGGVAISEDMDVRALQAKLAAQEARLNDLQAKMYSAGCDEGTVADGITTLRKNATITLGGTVNTRYFYRSGKVRSSSVDTGAWDFSTTPPTFGADNRVDAGSMQTLAKARGGDLFIADAKLEGKIDVNDNFDAYFKFDLQSSGNGASDNAEQFWVRWKNIGNSGFGILVGRDELKYGMGPSVGVLDSWSATSGGNAYDDMFAGLFSDTNVVDWANGAANNRMMAASGTMAPIHTGWDYSRVVQVNPYWENCDGSFKAELSFIQDVYYDANPWFENGNTGALKYRKDLNDGAGSMTGRITWKPLEGLTLVASAVNQYNKYAKSGAYWGEDDGSKNNFAASFGVEYTPAFLCDRLTLWGYYQHGWNEGWVKNMDSDLVNAGVKFNITDQFYAFAQGDYLYVKDKDITAGADTFYKAKGWAGYAGFGYVLPYGANFEAGYRHEKVSYKDTEGNKHFKYKSDTIYAHLGFNF